MCVRIRALVLYVSAKWALPPVSLTVFKVLPCEYSTTDSEAALSGGDFEGKTRFFFLSALIFLALVLFLLLNPVSLIPPLSLTFFFSFFFFFVSPPLLQ